jgi:primary-amine oxidase
MTDTAVRPEEPDETARAHPLDPATAAEYLAGREIMAAAGLLAEPTRFAYYGLAEPPKDEVLAAGPADRRLRAFLVQLNTGESTDVVVSLTHQKVVSARTLDPATDGQMPILDSDFPAVDEITKADPQWCAAMARRGYHDLSQIKICPITAGAYGPPEDDRRRMVRALAFVQAREHDLAWAHPVDGLAAYVDLVEKKVFKVTDEFELPVPQESGDYDDEAVRGPHRTTLKPIEITQPEGPSFTLDGYALNWQGWAMRIGFDAREGLSLHQISIDGRPVIYRASIPEMVVPYGDPRFRYWQAYFDTGEYLVGKFVNSLELGCDCLGEIAYLDATLTDDSGQPTVVKNAICVHEEDFGILWKHTDIFNGSAQSRRQRRLVVSYFTGRRLREPEPRGSGHPRLHRRRPGHRRRRHRGVAHVRPDPRAAARRLAGHAGRPVRLRAQAHRFLRPQPDPGRPAPRPPLLRPRPERFIGTDQVRLVADPSRLGGKYEPRSSALTSAL